MSEHADKLAKVRAKVLTCDPHTAMYVARVELEAIGLNLGAKQLESREIIVLAWAREKEARCRRGKHTCSTWTTRHTRGCKRCEETAQPGQLVDPPQK